MESEFKPLADAIYRERVLRARRTPPEERLLDGVRLYDQALDRTVAIRVLGERLLSEPTARERFVREARTASALNHPHVCTVTR